MEAYILIHCCSSSGAESCSTLCDPVDCGPLGSCPWDFSGTNTAVGYHFLLQEIFLTQGSDLCLLCLLHCKHILHHWATGEALYSGFILLFSDSVVSDSPWTAARQVSLSVTISRSLLQLTSIELVMPSNCQGSV